MVQSVPLRCWICNTMEHSRVLTWNVIRSIQHRNLLQIISTFSNNEFRALILQYMPHWSLEYWLYSHKYYLNLFRGSVPCLMLQWHWIISIMNIMNLWYTVTWMSWDLGKQALIFNGWMRNWCLLVEFINKFVAMQTNREYGRIRWKINDPKTWDAFCPASNSLDVSTHMSLLHLKTISNSIICYLCLDFSVRYLCLDFSENHIWMSMCSSV